jgi:hypothetical protein
VYYLSLFISDSELYMETEKDAVGAETGGEGVEIDR